MTTTMLDLLRRPIPPTFWVVDGLIPAGLFLLAADPKTGKSRFALDLSLSIAYGELFLDRFPTKKGDCLMVSNESGDISLARRALEMLGLDPDNHDPEGIEEKTAPDSDNHPLDHIFAERRLTKLTQGLEQELLHWASTVENPRLIVIDTLASVMPQGRGLDRRQDDYNALIGLADVALQLPHTAIIVIHHTNKRGADGGDPMMRISGSTGLTAATDGNAVMSKLPGDKIRFDFSPRDTKDASFELASLDNQRFRWLRDLEVKENSEKTSRVTCRQQILSMVKDSTEPLSPAAISRATGIKAATVSKTLKRLTDEGLVRQVERGHYATP